MAPVAPGSPGALRDPGDPEAPHRVSTLNCLFREKVVVFYLFSSFLGCLKGKKLLVELYTAHWNQGF